MTDVVGEKTVMDPQLTDTLGALKAEIFRTLNCVKVAQIQSVDAAKSTVQAQILFKRVLPNGTIADYPILVDCPIFTLQGGGGFLQMPVAAGDQCLILFSDRDIDSWFATGGSGAPATARCHHLSDGFALVGVNALNSPPPALGSDVNLKIPSSHKFSATNGSAFEALGTSLLALKSDVDNLLTFINNLITAFNAHTHTSAAPGNPTTTPTVPFSGTPPTMVGTTKLKGS